MNLARVEMEQEKLAALCPGFGRPVRIFLVPMTRRMTFYELSGRRVEREQLERPRGVTSAGGDAAGAGVFGMESWLVDHTARLEAAYRQGLGGRLARICSYPS